MGRDWGWGREQGGRVGKESQVGSGGGATRVAPHGGWRLPAVGARPAGAPASQPKAGGACRRAGCLRSEHGAAGQGQDIAVVEAVQHL